MSSAILRRNSSKQGLQNLMRVTAQRSIEDAEEVERERRRRARESFRRMSSNSGPGESSQENGTPAEDSMYDDSLKPSSSPSLEEDEGFSDWTQRREKRRQQRMQELSQGAEQEEKEAPNGPVPEKTLQVSVASSARLQRQQKEQEDVDRARVTSERRKEREEESLRAERARREKERKEEEEEQRKREELMRVSKTREEGQRPDAKVDKQREMKVSYTSKVFLQQEVNHSNTNGNTAQQEVTSYVNNKTKRPTSRAVVQAAEPPDEAGAILETEQRLEKIRRSHQEKESQELEQLRHRQVEAEQELEELKRRREERRRVREEEERRREDEEQQRLAKEEEERRQMKEDIERRRMEAAERMKTLSVSSVDGDEMFSPISPKSPTYKTVNEEGLTGESTSSITERTESLNRSLKKSNSFKKTQPPVLLSRIDDKMEQYAHAIENSQEARAAKQGLMDIPSPPEAVASKKNLFEAGEAWSPTKGMPCKDAEGMKVGVAGLITQWVKGNPDSAGKQLASRPADVKPGDVMQKRNMWEVIGDTSGRPGQRARGTSGKRYKFVVTGHGKYEKIPVDDENGDDFTTSKPDLYEGDY
ncbi:uncharacterized protein lsp1a isoform 2-T2 [Polymixia lowei]